MIKQLWFRSIQRFKGKHKQCSSSGMAVSAPFSNGSIYVIFFTVNILPFYFFSQFFSSKNHKEEQNMFIRHKINFSWLFFRNSRHGRSCEDQVEVTLFLEIFAFVRDIHLLGCFLICTRRRRMSKSL